MPTQSEEIKRLRERSGLTQGEAANRLNMKKRTFGGYERGEREVKWKTMQKIRRVLGGSKVAGVSNESYNSDVKRYPLAEASGDSTPTVHIDTRIQTVEESMPDPENATAHYVTGRFMGPWMRERQHVIAEDCSSIETAGRYVVRWGSGEEKAVAEISRIGDDAIQITSYAPREKQTLRKKEETEDGTLYVRDDGIELTMEVLGRVIIPAARGQRITEEMSDHLSKAIEASSE